MEKLRNFRKEQGLSQKDMAEKIGVTLSMYEKVESGRAGASAAFMSRIKSAFPSVIIDDIFFSDNSNKIAVDEERSHDEHYVSLQGNVARAEF